MESKKNLEDIKNLLNAYFEENKVNTVKSRVGKNTFYFNRELFQLEMHLSSLKQDYNVNQSLNTQICSDNILKSFDIAPTFYRSEDYCLSFLIHLTNIDCHNAESLLEIIRDYCDKIKDKLAYQDLIITSSGVTRSHTNVRFALKWLRDHGLVYNEINYKRSILPTPLGYLVSLFMNRNVLEALPISGNNVPYYALKPLISIINDFRKEPNDFITKLLSKEKVENKDKNLHESLMNILNQYHDRIMPHIYLTEGGITLNKEKYDEAILNFYQDLKESIGISQEFSRIFKKLRTSI